MSKMYAKHGEMETDESAAPKSKVGGVGGASPLRSTRLKRKISRLEKDVFACAHVENKSRRGGFTNPTRSLRIGGEDMEADDRSPVILLGENTLVSSIKEQNVDELRKMAKAKVTKGKAVSDLHKKTKRNEKAKQKYQRMTPEQKKVRSAQVMAAREKRIRASVEEYEKYTESKKQYYRTSKVKQVLSKTEKKGFTCYKQKCNFGGITSTIVIPPKVEVVYGQIFSGTQNVMDFDHGGYGELTIGSLHSIVVDLIAYTGFNDKSTILDIGSGVGKPILHFSQCPAPAYAVGIEVAANRFAASVQNLDQAFKTLSVNETPLIRPKALFVKGDISDVKTFNGFSHLYSFDACMGVYIEYIAMAWNNSPGTKYYTSNFTLNELINAGFENVECIHNCGSKRMTGKCNRTFFIYKRNGGSSKGKIGSIDPIFREPIRAINLGQAETYNAHLLPDITKGVETRSQKRI